MRNLSTLEVIDKVELFAHRLEELALTLKALNSYVHDKSENRDGEALREMLILYGNTVADWLETLKEEADEVKEEVFSFLDRLEVGKG